MSQHNLTSFRQFFKMHKHLIKSLYFLDTMLLICTSWYLFVPVSTGIYPFRTIILLFLFFLCFVGLHIRVLGSRIGSIGFYRLLPVRRFITYCESHFVTLLPFSVALFTITTLSIALFPNTAADEKVLKTFQIFAVFCTIKLLTLPALLLIRRCLFLLPCLFFMIIPIALVISAGNECIWGSSPLSGAWDMGIYSLLLFGLETIIVKTVKVS